MTIDYPTQIAIIAGVLGSVCLLLAIGMIVLWTMIRRLRQTLAETRAQQPARDAEKPDTATTSLEKTLSRHSHHLSTSNLSPSDDGLSSKFSLYVTQPVKVNGTSVLPTYSYPVRPSAYLRNSPTAKYDSALSTPTVASPSALSANINLLSSNNSMSGRTRSNNFTPFQANDELIIR